LSHTSRYEIPIDKPGTIWDSKHASRAGCPRGISANRGRQRSTVAAYVGRCGR